MPIPVGSTAFPPPLPVSPNKVSTVLMSAPVDPGDILVVQQATMQANTPVLALRVAKLDSAQFIVDMGVDPPTIKSIAPGVTAAWATFTPTISSSTAGVTFTPSSLNAKYTQSGKIVMFSIDWRGTLSIAANDIAFTPPVLLKDQGGIFGMALSVFANVGGTPLAVSSQYISAAAQASQRLFAQLVGQPFPAGPTVALKISGAVEAF